MIDVLEITEVHAAFDGDTYFPTFNTANFELISQHYHPTDENHQFSFTFKTWVRKECNLSNETYQMKKLLALFILGGLIRDRGALGKLCLKELEFRNQKGRAY